MGELKSGLNNIKNILSQITITDFNLIWKGTSNSWEFGNDKGIANQHLVILNKSKEGFNALDRDNSFQSLMLSSRSFHCNYFKVDFNFGEEYTCIGIVERYDAGKRPCSLSCTVYLRSDLQSITDCLKFILGQLPDRVSDPDIPITRRERDILELLAEGKSQKQIAAILGISNSTVESHKSRLFSKFQVRSSAELINRAYLS